MRDFVRAFETSAERGQWSGLVQILRERMAAAAIHADLTEIEELARPLHDDPEQTE